MTHHTAHVGIDSLPDSLVSAVLCSFVPWRDRFYKLSRVSRRWRALCWRSIHGNASLDLTWCTGEYELDSVVHSLASCQLDSAREASKLEAFQVYGPRVTCSVVQRLVTAIGLYRIRDIRIESKQADDKAIAALSSCAELTHLVLNCVKLTSSSMAAISRSCRKLQVVNLAGSSRICDDAVIAVANNCPELRVLNLFMCHRVSDRAMVALVIRKHKTLIQLTLDRCIKISGLALCYLIKTQPNLRCLSFANCPKVNDHDFTPFIKDVNDETAQLVRVDMSGCASLGNAGVGALLGKYAGTLEALSLRGFYQLTSASFRTVARCLLLRDLNLGLCRSLDNQDLTHIVAGCPLLQRLNLQGCVHIDDDGAEAIAQHGKKLECLSLEFCYNITDDGIMPIMASCDHLVDLNLKALNQLTLDTFDNLIRLKSNVANLQRINIGACADFETTLMYASVIKRRYPRARIEWV